VSCELGISSSSRLVLSQRLYTCVREFGDSKIEIRSISCLFARCWYQPGRERLVPLEGKTRHIPHDSF